LLLLIQRIKDDHQFSVLPFLTEWLDQSGRINLIRPLAPLGRTSLLV
jgi:hypothetical protein